MQPDFGKRGRKAGRAVEHIHKVVGVQEIRIQIVVNSFQYPIIFRKLNDALHEAAKDVVGFQELHDALVEECTPLTSHRALFHISLWAACLGLLDTGWAITLAARVVLKALDAPATFDKDRVFWAALDTARRFRDMQNEGFEQIKEEARFESADIHSVPAKVGFRSSITGDFPLDEVTSWLTWRLVECNKARHRGKRALGWTALADRTEGVDHKTVKKHTVALAEFAGVPITCLQ